MSNETFQAFLVYLDHLMSEAADTYRGYLSEGKTYGAAKRLWAINDKLYNHLNSGKPSVPPEIARDMEDILHHLHAWREKWIAHEAELHPAPNDLFAFENPVTFPKLAAARLSSLIKKD